MSDENNNQNSNMSDAGLINNIIEKMASAKAEEEMAKFKENSSRNENDNKDFEKNNNSKELKNTDLKDFKEIEFKLENITLGKSAILSILDDVRVIKKRIAHIENVLREQERSQYSPAKDLPGVIGKYDGLYMVTADGTRIEVPVNYAAKSLLVYGDELKRIEEDGKHAFKIISKVNRKKIEGVLSKKDGKYVLLSDAGTFKLHKSAVEFRNIKQGEWVSAYIPEVGAPNDFAAIDKVVKKDKEVKLFEPKKNTDQRPVSAPVKPYLKTEERPKSFEAPQSQPQRQEPPRQEPPRQEPPRQEPQSPKTPPQNPLPKITFSDDELV